MRILIAASEAVPYAKVGGLADVTGALAAVLARLGHEVRLVMPKYELIDYMGHGLFPAIEEMHVFMPPGIERCKIHHHANPRGFDAFFVENHGYFSRPGIYGGGDDGFRFAFFCQAVLQLCRHADFSPDVIHVHDWPTALIPALLKYTCAEDPWLAYTGSVLTIHNAAHQGKFPFEVFAYSGLPDAAFTDRQFEDFGGVNLLKGGVAQADLLSAVSPTYAREILGPIGGNGLDPYLLDRHADLHGILNGADYDIWNPEHDPLIPAHYTDNDLAGKVLCKRAVQEHFGLRPDPEAPLFGVVARLVAQKGLELVAGALDRMVGAGAQFVLLGTGEQHLEDYFRTAPGQYPGRVGTMIAFDNRLAHMIEAGADFFLMPSLFEPCGLNQIYSMRYGTLPIVRATGGLEDTVWDYDPSVGNGTGFKFGDISVDSLLGAVARALDVYWNHRDHLYEMVKTAMSLRFTWEQAAERYLEIYGWAIEKRRHWRVSP